jgi:hypothetical protein
MTQVTKAQGDMARTLNDPANQIRILKSQVEQLARSLGNIFIPMLNAVLPYLIAFAKVARTIAGEIANLVGFELPEVKYENTEKIPQSLEDANKAAKKLKKNLLGIDELNILGNDDSSGDSLGTGFDFELPEYDFLGSAVNSRVNEIVEKMKEWLGITEDIDSWSDLLNTKLGDILKAVGLIGAGMALWKITDSTLNGIKLLKALLATPKYSIVIGATLAIVGFTIAFDGLKEAIEKGLDKYNFAGIVGGSLLTAAGAAVFGSGLATWIETAFAGSAVDLAFTQAGINLGVGTVGAAGAALAAGIAGIVLGIPAFFVGIWDACKNGFDWLNGLLIPAGSAAAGAGIGAIIGSLGGPIGAGIGALIGLAVGLVTDGIILVCQNWDKITAFIKNFFTVTIPTMWNSFVSWLENLPQTIKQWFTDLWQPVRDFDWYGFGQDIGFKAGTAVKNICEAFKTFFTETLPSVWEGVKNAFRTFFTQTLPNFFTETIPTLWETIKTSFKTFFTQTLPNALSGIGEWFKGVGVAVWEGIKLGWTTKVNAVVDFVKGFVDGFKEALGIHSPSTVFADIGHWVIEGLKKGITDRINSLKQTISSVASSVTGWFKDVLGIHSPSKVFYELAGFTIDGYNEGFERLGKSTEGVVTNWADSITAINPTMSFAMDTSALKYYNSDSFAKSVSANVGASATVTATGFMEGMEEFYREYVAPTMSQMASDMRRQADKKEQTVVQIGNRTVSDAVTTQQRANGYVFAR